MLCNHFQNGDGPLGFAGDQMIQCHWQSTSKWKKFDYQNHFQIFFFLTTKKKKRGDILQR